jgi:hypothetical protein
MLRFEVGLGLGTIGVILQGFLVILPEILSRMLPQSYLKIVEIMGPRSNLIFSDLSTHTKTHTQTMAHHHHHPPLSQHQYSSCQPQHGMAVMQMSGQVGCDCHVVITPPIVRGIWPSP